MDAALRSGLANQRSQRGHDQRRQNVHSEKTQVMSGAEAGHDQPLLRLGGSRLFDDVLDLVKPASSRHQPTTDRAVEREFALMRGLNRRNRAGFARSHLDQLLRATFRRATEIKMIADQQQDWITTGKIGGAGNRVAVTERSGLLHELQPLRLRSSRRPIGLLVTGTDHDANLFHPGLENLLDDDGNGGFLDAIAIDERLQRNGALIFSGGGDDGFLDLHVETFSISRAPRESHNPF